MSHSVDYEVGYFRRYNATVRNSVFYLRIRIIL